MNTKTTRISASQVDEQLAYCHRIRALWMERGITPKAYVETYGCQQNEADSERLRGMLSDAGYAICDEAEGADVVIMNTCAIREHAEQRVSAIWVPSPTSSAATRAEDLPVRLHGRAGAGGGAHP